MRVCSILSFNLQQLGIAQGCRVLLSQHFDDAFILSFSSRSGFKVQHNPIFRHLHSRIPHIDLKEKKNLESHYGSITRYPNPELEKTMSNHLLFFSCIGSFPRDFPITCSFSLSNNNNNSLNTYDIQLASNNNVSLRTLTYSALQ